MSGFEFELDEDDQRALKAANHVFWQDQATSEELSGVERRGWHDGKELLPETWMVHDFKRLVEAGLLAEDDGRYRITDHGIHTNAVLVEAANKTTETHMITDLPETKQAGHTRKRRKSKSS